MVHLKVVEMEACLQEVNNAIPSREAICALAEKFRYGLLTQRFCGTIWHQYLRILGHDNKATNAINLPSLSISPDRAGKFVVQPKQVESIEINSIQICIFFGTSCLFWLSLQVWNWFQNRRYAQRAKVGKAPGKLSVSPMPREDSTSFRNVAPPISAPPGTFEREQSSYPITLVHFARFSSHRIAPNSYRTNHLLLQYIRKDLCSCCATNNIL